MIVVHCKAYLQEVSEFAEAENCLAELLFQLDYLGTYGGDGGTRCLLYKDIAPLSFAFIMEKLVEGSTRYKRWFNGGLIYSGPGQPLNGSFPALTVSLDPEAGKAHGWSVHT